MANQSYKISLVGNSGVGKTSLLTKYVKGIYTPSNVPTIGANFLTKEIVISNQHLDLNIWDTAGQEIYRSLTPMYYRNACAAIVVFDVTAPSSFESVKNWVSELRTNEPNIIIFICGNKIDDVEKRKITFQEIQLLAEQLSVFFAETSAATGQGIDQLFQFVTLEILKGGNVQSSLPPIEAEPEKTKNNCC